MHALKARHPATLLITLTLISFAHPSALLAQEDEAPPPIEDWGAAEGTAENPDAPKEFGSVEEKKAPVRVGYPRELVLRPLTLDAGMTEVSLDVPALLSPARVKGQLGVAYGINNQIQLGLLYGPGALRDPDGFVAGKAVGIDVRYLVTDFLSVQAALPILINPFAMGVTLGAPMKFEFWDKLAFVFGQDLLTANVVSFAPVVGDPLETQRQIELDESGTTGPRGEVRVLGGVMYQMDPDLAFMGELGLVYPDFGREKTMVPMWLALMYSPGAKVDLGLRAGFESLSQAKDYFGVRLFVAVRI